MLLFVILALAIVIAGIVLIARGQTIVGVVVIVVGIMVYLLRAALDSGASEHALAALQVVGLR